MKVFLINGKMQHAMPTIYNYFTSAAQQNL